MRTPGKLVSLVTLALAAACSSSTPTAVETPTPTPSPTATVVVPPSPTASPTPSATPTPVVPTGSESPAPLGQPTCKASAVTITDADTVVKPGYRAEVYVLRTTGAPCQLTGYPSVLVNGATVTRGGSGLPPETVHAYTLSRATSLSFALATARPGASCDDQTAITVTLPGTSQPRGVVTDLRVCDHQLGVSPVHRLGDDE
ncbi:MAG: hypothetical protein JWO22_4168 [Frankiales bacterium]|nr:hypothetical protein [Frankiales bacterium]